MLGADWPPALLVLAAGRPAELAGVKYAPPGGSEYPFDRAYPFAFE